MTYNIILKDNFTLNIFKTETVLQQLTPNIIDNKKLFSDNSPK